MCDNVNESAIAMLGLFILLDDFFTVYRDCSEVTKLDEDDMFCITATAVEDPKGALLQVDLMQDRVIPFLLGTVIKGL